MASTATQKFAAIALPILTALSPTIAQADCSDDQFGYNQTLDNIEISRDQAQEVINYNTDAPALFKAAAENASAEVIKSVLSQYIGTDFIEDGIPAYPAYEDALNAFLCAMADLLDTRILYTDASKKYFALEEGLIELMIKTAVTEDDIRGRIETLSDHAHASSLKPRQHEYSHADMFIDRAKGMVSYIAADPERAEGFVSFIVNEIQNTDAPLKRAGYARLLGALALENNEYIPHYLNVVDQDRTILNSTLGMFISDLNTADYNGEIEAIITDQLQNAETVNEQKLASNMLSRFTVINERLLALD